MNSDRKAGRKEKKNWEKMRGTVIEVGVLHPASGLLNDLDEVEVDAPLEPENGINAELCEVLLVLGDDLG